MHIDDINHIFRVANIFPQTFLKAQRLHRDHLDHQCQVGPI